VKPLKSRSFVRVHTAASLASSAASLFTEGRGERKSSNNNNYNKTKQQPGQEQSTRYKKNKGARKLGQHSTVLLS
jgi:hypothetical protein